MRKFDLFPKVADETFDVRTKTGGVISLLTFIFMVVIVIVEIQSERRGKIVQKAVLDNYFRATSDPHNVFFNMTVSYPCHLLQISVQDITGNHQIDFAKTITRQRLDKNDKPLFQPIRDDDPKSIFNSCGSCHGSNYTKCCLTCVDIASSFILQNKPVPNLDNLDQCKRDQKAIHDQEKCRIWGELTTSFSNGQILFNAGGQLKMPVHYKHDLTYFGENVNLTHYIHTFRFGPDFIGLKNPLDNAHWSQPGRGFFFCRYSLNLVKTYSDGIVGNQYSANFNHRQIDKTVSKRHPGIAFDFETAPIAVKIYVERKSIIHFVTGLLAVLGGGFTIGGLIDSFLFSINTHRD